MKKLIKIRLVQFFLYETLDIDIGMTCGIFGANGSGGCGKRRYPCFQAALRDVLVWVKVRYGFPSSRTARPLGAKPCCR